MLTLHLNWGRYANLIAALAQLVEQFTRNDQVNGFNSVGWLQLKKTGILVAHQKACFLILLTRPIQLIGLSHLQIKIK